MVLKVIKDEFDIEKLHFYIDMGMGGFNYHCFSVHQDYLSRDLMKGILKQFEKNEEAFVEMNFIGEES